jgi:hypothetical protein
MGCASFCRSAVSSLARVQLSQPFLHKKAIKLAAVAAITVRENESRDPGNRLAHTLQAVRLAWAHRGEEKRFPAASQDGFDVEIAA